MTISSFQYKKSSKLTKKYEAENDKLDATDSAMVDWVAVNKALPYQRTPEEKV